MLYVHIPFFFLVVQSLLPILCDKQKRSKSLPSPQRSLGEEFARNCNPNGKLAPVGEHGIYELQLS